MWTIFAEKGYMFQVKYLKDVVSHGLVKWMDMDDLYNNTVMPLSRMLFIRDNATNEKPELDICREKK